MERQKHRQEKHGNSPNQHHFKEGAYNKHAGTHFYQEGKSGQQIKHDHEYPPVQKHDHEKHEA